MSLEFVLPAPRTEETWASRPCGGPSSGRTARKGRPTRAWSDCSYGASKRMVRVFCHEPPGVARQVGQPLRVLAAVRAADAAVAVDQDEPPVVEDRPVGGRGQGGDGHPAGLGHDRVLVAGEEPPARLVGRVPLTRS